MIDLAKFDLDPAPKCAREPGEKAGMWTLLAFGRKPGTWQTFAIAQCECGSEPVKVRLGNITQGLSSNCGCVRSARLTRHGLAARGSDTRGGIHRVWQNMVQRCTDPKHAAYERYGGRGITVSEEWQNPLNFVADMGDEYRKGLSIERRDNDAGYSKANCYWATRSEQTRNRRTTLMLTVEDVTKPLAKWAEDANLSYSAVITRVRKGWNSKEAVTRKSHRGKRRSDVGG